MNRSRALVEAVDRLIDDGEAMLEAYLEQAVAQEEDARFPPRLSQPDYQLWYSRALPVVAQLSPDRHLEFVGCYEPPAKRSVDAPITSKTFVLLDHFRSFKPSGTNGDQAASQLVALLRRQLLIVRGGRERLESVLADIRGTLQAEVFDDELSAASDLHKKGHLRAAGAVAGVVLEGHLQTIAGNHKITIRKKNPTIADLNDPLKKANVYDTAPWRRIQHLADLRNQCVHAKDREPTTDEVDQLISGVSWAIKNTF